MPRPPKEPSERKNVDVRVPLTEEQKRIIADAAAEDGTDVATWVRPIILRAAAKRLSRDDNK